MVDDDGEAVSGDDGPGDDIAGDGVGDCGGGVTAATTTTADGSGYSADGNEPPDIRHPAAKSCFGARSGNGCLGTTGSRYGGGFCSPRGVATGAGGRLGVAQGFFGIALCSLGAFGVFQNRDIKSANFQNGFFGRGGYSQILFGCFNSLAGSLFLAREKLQFGGGLCRRTALPGFTSQDRVDEVCVVFSGLVHVVMLLAMKLKLFGLLALGG